MRNKVAKEMRRSYNKVKTLKPARSVFDLSHEWLGTCDMGKIYPFFWSEMSPGDTFHMSNEMVVRAQPLLAPILHRVSMYTHYFFVPYRILWEEWELFITGGEEGSAGGSAPSQYDEDLPAPAPELPRWNPLNTAVGSLWDYLGLPTGVTPAGALPLDFIRRVYNRIWNEYYRDENLQERVAEDNETILNRNWKKDYFTSALLNQQRGVAPALPVSGSAPIIQENNIFWSTNNRLNQYSVSISRTGNSVRVTGSIDTNLPYDETILDYAHHINSIVVYTSGSIGNIEPINITTDNTSVAQTPDGKVYIDLDVTGTIPISTDLLWNNRIGLNAYITATTQYADLNNVVATNISDLRVAFNIQKWLEQANRGGVRYTEFLRSFFGVSPKDSRLQRPEYIGGTKSPLIVSEVLQTSSTSDEPSPQGNMAGHGIGASRSFAGSYTAVEFGMVMGLFSIMPETKYTQGINRQLLRRTKFDFLFPQFTHLSEQAIEGAEIYATADAEENRKVWGFNEIYDELRSIPSKIVGKMRTTFNYWHLARIFDEKPVLNSDFIKCDPSKRIFAVENEDGFIVNIANIVKAVRPLPKYGTPGGV